MRSLLSSLSAVVLIAIAMTLPARAQGLAGLVTEARGKVEILRPGAKWTGASIMAPVPEGSQIRVAGGGHATVSFVRGGMKATLTGPVTAAFTAGGARAIAGGEANLHLTQGRGRDALGVPPGVNVSKMGGHLVRGVPALVVLVGPTVLTPDPVLMWHRGKETVSKRLRLTIKQGSKPIVNQVIEPSESQFQVQPGTLEAGKTYAVTLQAIGHEIDLPSGRIDLKVLDPVARQHVEKAREEAQAALQADPRDPSPLAVLAYIYVDRGMLDQAIETCEQITRLRPDATDAWALLFRLYKEVGLDDKAEAIRPRTGSHDLTP